MKIVCNKNEFAQLVRECTLIKAGEVCENCIFAFLCSQGGDELYDEVMCAIEDICEVREDG